MRELATGLIRCCESFLVEDCGRTDPTGIADPWLDYEESYKRAHSYGVRRTVGGASETSHDPADLAALNDRYQLRRVQEAFVQGGFDRRRFSQRWNTIKGHGPFSAFEREAKEVALRDLTVEIRRAEDGLQAAYSAVDAGVNGARRLEQLLRNGYEETAGTLYRKVLSETNLVTWSHWPPFSRELGLELVDFLNANEASLSQQAFDRFVRFLSGQPSPERTKKTPLGAASVRTVATFWLMMLNPSLYVYLRRDSFAEALSPTYRDHGSSLITYDDYAAVLDGASTLAEALSEVDTLWAPRDLIDIQTLLWMRLGTGWRPPRAPRRQMKDRPGVSYRTAEVADFDASLNPSVADADRIERGLRGHVDTQNSLAEFLKKNGVTPLSPGENDPEFDIAWRQGAIFFVGEVKSTTDENIEKQLRLGLGQVLRYRQQLQERTRQVHAVLIAEKAPDKTWTELCHSLNVTLVWPGTFEEVLRTAASE